jgi:N-acetylmuramoyl-L-alanine amidase
LHIISYDGIIANYLAKPLVIMLLSRCTECETSSVRGLDLQLLYQINLIKPGLLVRIDDIPDLILGSSVHPWAQAGMRKCLINALKDRSGVAGYPPSGVKMMINSAYRTIVGQQLLRSHYENKRCNIVAAAPPGKSNHNNASSIDIEDADGWEEALTDNGFTKLGDFDPMHYDCTVGIVNMMPVSVLAFQQLWNLANPNDKLAADGDMGMLTTNRLKNAPIEGFGNLPALYPQRMLKYTEPLQAGNDVGKLQLSLREAGIQVEKIDKIFGPKLDKAVKEYQTRVGLKADGIVAKATLTSLNPPPPSIA